MFGVEVPVPVVVAALVVLVALTLKFYRDGGGNGPGIA